MADFVFNIAKGRVAELYNRVDLADPSTAAIIIVPVSVGGTSDATIKDFATLSAVLAGGVTERTANGWSRKVYVAADTAAMSPDNSNDRMDIDIGDATWTAVSSGAVTDLIICYRPATASADTVIVPLTQHDFAVTPDGSDVIAQIATAGFFRAS